MAPIRCCLHVQQGARAETVKKADVQVVEIAKHGHCLQIKGLRMRPLVQIFGKDLDQVGDSKLAAGTLVLSCADGLQVRISNAQQGQLADLLRRLRGGESALQQRSSAVNSVATPAKASKRPATATAREEPGSCGPQCPRISLVDLPHQMLEMILAYAPDQQSGARLAEACSFLERMICEGKGHFRLLQSQAASVPPDELVQRVQRRVRLTVLDLSGCVMLSARAATSLAEVLASGPYTVRRLGLRGCKAMNDSGVRRLVNACPLLECLDLLQIPKLSNEALKAPLPNLRILAAGSLGRFVMREHKKLEVPTNLSVSQKAQTAPLPSRRAPTFESLFSSDLLQMLNRPFYLSANGQGTAGSVPVFDPPPLTHLALLRCEHLQVLYPFAATLRHLDLCGSSIQVPSAAAKDWRPLAACVSLEVLVLSGCRLLGEVALVSCLSSLPTPSHLRVLDVAETTAQERFFSYVAQEHRALTHLRAADCFGMRTGTLHSVLHHLTKLQVLDVSGCRSIEPPLDGLLPRAQDQSSRPEERPLRLLALGRTALADNEWAPSQRALARWSPPTKAVLQAIDLLGDYEQLPPNLL